MIFMEIRSVVNKVENEYPKMKEISKKHLSNSIPNKWIKAGLSSLAMAMITKNNILAVNIPPDFIDMTLAGNVREIITTPLPVRICNAVFPILQIASAVVFIITGLGILTTKIKAKKQNEPKKVKKWIKVTFIISIVVFIISKLTYDILSILY